MYCSVLDTAWEVEKWGLNLNWDESKKLKISK